MAQNTFDFQGTPCAAEMNKTDRGPLYGWVETRAISENINVCPTSMARGAGHAGISARTECYRDAAGLYFSDQQLKARQATPPSA